MYVYILSYFVNKLEIRWLYLSPIENTKLNDLSNILKIRYIQMTKIQKGQYIVIINSTKNKKIER